ncbi:hypothetical protein HMP09_2312 [Sphingomonas sp. HMP9]|nr:hypothetical protein HMP09_2312 [Sphingomonas sp. HMP9]
MRTPLPGSQPLPIVPLGKYGRPDINPYDRDIALTVPLTYRDRTLGEVPVLLTHDDRFVVDTQPFLKLLRPLLNDVAQSKLAAILAGTKTFTSADLATSGVSLDYDPGSLSVVVLRIAPDERTIEPLFTTPTRDDEKPDLQPAFVSGYLNANLAVNKLWGLQDRLSRPSFYVNGAIRVGPVVVEGDLQYAEELGLTGGTYRFDRNTLRLVYDQPEQFRRWYLGDLSPEIRGQQGYVQMGGIGVSRQRQRFDQFRAALLQGNRQLILQRPSTVDVYRNGSLLKQFRLDAGSYDVSALPLVTGGNDVQVEVRDDSGGVQSLNYASYLDPIDLQPGDFEYAGYLGKTSRRFGRTPIYDGDLAFTGFYRKAFLDRPAIGVGVQASKQVQVVTGQTQFVLANSGRIQFDLGASRARRHGGGYSSGVTYDQIFDRAGLIDSFTVRADYLSRRFAGLGYIDPDNSSSWSFNAQYARAITFDWTALIGASYIRSRGTFGDTSRVNASVSYRLSRGWSVRGGADYTRYGTGSSRRNGLGFSASIIVQPSYRDRAEARHDSSIGTSSVSYVHASSNRIGALGYGGLVSRDAGDANVQAFADYTGNRFDASVSHSAFGTGFGRIGDQQITSLRVGTAIAFADGQFGVGRRINDSFAILYPHPTLKGHSVVAGQSIAGNDYLSKSGFLGGAVNGYLSSYVTQSVQYDVDNPPPGYDVGLGVVRVKPFYRSGYKLEVGSDAFVSAVGNLLLATGKPVSLIGGRVIDLDRKDAPLVFFTNSVGRFAIQNLRPANRYRVELYGTAATFDFVIPKDTHGLVDLQTVKLSPAN